MNYNKNYRIILLVIAFFVALVPIFSQTGAWYQGKIIKNITFEGLSHVKNHDLDGVIEPYIGQKFDDELFWELQGRLYALEYFDEISTTTLTAGEGEVVLKFTVKERPVISKIIFSGNKELSTSKLRDVISIKVEDVFNESNVNLDRQSIITKYVEEGFPDINIRYEIVKNQNLTVNITFLIAEGERITINQINFEGNEQFSTRTLRGQLSLKVKSIMNSGAFQEAKLIADRYTIEQYYHDRGYIDASITDVTRSVAHDGKGAHINLTFKIEEGMIYTFEGVVFEGNQIFSEKELQALVHSKAGKIVNARMLEADLQRVADLYYENGYIYNTITREPKQNPEEGTLGYVVHIKESGRAHIEHIIIHGNKKTKNAVILRELPLETGDIFSKARLFDGLRNLYNLQYFSSVIPDTPQGSVDGLLDLVFTLEEQPTTDIQLGLTFSGSSDPNDIPISGLVKWTDRNFLGYGNIFGVEGNVSTTTQNVSVQYTQRWIFGLPLSGGFDLTVQHSERLAAMNNHAPFFDGDEDNAYPDGFDSYDEYTNANKLPPDEYLFEYQQWSVLLGFSTGYRWGTPLGTYSLGGGTRIGFKYNNYDRDLYRAFDKTLRENENWTPAMSLFLSTSLDKRDIFYDPSKGYYISQRFGVYGLLPNELEEEYYMRSDTKAETFWTLWNWNVFDSWSFKGVFGIHSGISLLFPQPGIKAPLIEDVNRLSIDGMFTARGWIGERSNRGLALWENWAELRIPVVPGVLAIDGFFDAAQISDTPGDLFGDDSRGNWPERMRFSFGGGLRFAIPQFPFRFLFAKRFKIVDGDVQWQPGMIGSNNGSGGVDFVLSFVLSTY